MPARQVTGCYKRKAGRQYWVVACPYCEKNHWMDAGPYTANPMKDCLRTLPCGSFVEIVPDAASKRRVEKVFATEDG